jgi:diacylglycerol O-acyltransferase-1
LPASPSLLIDHPLLRKKVPKFVATVLIFTLSAFLHEVVISVPFHTVSFHAFFGMLGQIPLTMISRLMDRTFDNAFIGNALFWFSFCIVGKFDCMYVRTFV